MALPSRTARPKAAAALEICLYEEINTWSVRSIVERLQAAPGADVTLRINSPGGDVQEGFALSSALRTHQGRKVAVVEGVCASAATFPLCACDEVRMHPESLVMLHAPWGGASGTADQIEDYAQVLRQMESLMVGMYMRRTGADEETVKGWMARDTWWTPAEAVEAGLADAVIADAPAPPARASAARFAALLKLPIRAPKQPAKNTRNTKMNEELRDKLAKHGLAEDGGNMEEAYSAYMSETEDGPAERKEMARAMEEMKESKAKAEDDKPEEESSTGDGKSKARIRQDAASDPAVQRLIASLTGQVTKMSKQVERYEQVERKRAESEFFAAAEMHTSRKEAEEYVSDCDGDLAKALRLIQKLPKKAGALSRWYAGGSPIGGGSNPAADSYETTKVINLGRHEIHIHGRGLSALAKKIAADRKIPLREAMRAAVRERPDLYQRAAG